MSAKPKLFPAMFMLLVGVSSPLYPNHYGMLAAGENKNPGGFRDILNPEIVIQPDSFYVVTKVDTVR